MQKLILIGGSFNPIHLGHLKLISLACCQDNVAKIIVMPAYCSPFKTQAMQLAAPYRWQLLDLAINDLVNLEQDFTGITKAEQKKVQEALVSNKLELMDLEIKSNTPSYTWTSIQRLKQLYPDYELCLLGGSDLLADFTKWYEFRLLLANVKLLIATRPGYLGEELKLAKEKLITEYKAKIEIIEATMPDVSSQLLRQELKNLPTSTSYSLTASDIGNYYCRADIFQLCPLICKAYLSKQEYAFILQNRLYQQPNLADFLSEEGKQLVSRLQNYLLKNLPWRRQTHCMNVAYFALTLLIAYYQLPTSNDKQLAECIFNAPWQDFSYAKLNSLQKQMCEKTIIAGLFHDGCKYANLADFPTVLAQLSAEDKTTHIEHGPIAAAVLEHEFGYTDKTVLEAIYYHTTLRPNATLLDKIVYLADKLEFGRTYQDVPNLRKSLILGYDETVRRVLVKTIALLESKGQRAHSLSKLALAQLEEEKF